MREVRQQPPVIALDVFFSKFIGADGSLEDANFEPRPNALAGVGGPPLIASGGGDLDGDHASQLVRGELPRGKPELALQLGVISGDLDRLSALDAVVSREGDQHELEELIKAGVVVDVFNIDLQ